MQLTESEKRRICEKLTAAKELLEEAYAIIRSKDTSGESHLAVRVDSNRNDIDDTIDTLENA